MEEREAKEWAGVDSDVDAEPATADQSSKRRELEALCVQNNELRTLLDDKRRVTQALASQVANMEASNQVLHDSLARRETELAAQQDDYERAASGLATKMLDLQAREKLLLEKSANLKGSIERDVKLQLSRGAASVRVRELETETDLYLRLDALESKRMRVHHLEAEVARGRQELEMRRDSSGRGKHSLPARQPRWIPCCTRLESMKRLRSSMVSGPSVANSWLQWLCGLCSQSACA